MRFLRKKGIHFSDDALFVEISDVPGSFLSVPVVEDLCRNGFYGIGLFELGVFMNVDENDFSGALIVLFYFFEHGTIILQGMQLWEPRSIMVTFPGTGACIS